MRSQIPYKQNTDYSFNEMCILHFFQLKLRSMPLPTFFWFKLLGLYRSI
jgi:hypothetical protein